MRKTKEQNRGITLIALVITIIVMLILVAVTISMAVNGGIFNYAGKAVGDTKNAKKAEENISKGGIKVGDKQYNTIDEYIKQTQKEETIECKICKLGYIFSCDYECPGCGRRCS